MFVKFRLQNLFGDRVYWWKKILKKQVINLHQLLNKIHKTMSQKQPRDLISRLSFQLYIHVFIRHHTCFSLTISLSFCLSVMCCIMVSWPGWLPHYRKSCRNSKVGTLSQNKAYRNIQLDLPGLESKTRVVGEGNGKAFRKIKLVLSSLEPKTHFVGEWREKAYV
jgi:hypothetical protein